jgi:hypothetical protein
MRANNNLGYIILIEFGRVTGLKIDDWEVS